MAATRGHTTHRPQLSRDRWRGKPEPKPPCPSGRPACKRSRALMRVYPHVAVGARSALAAWHPGRGRETGPGSPSPVTGCRTLGTSQEVDMTVGDARERMSSSTETAFFFRATLRAASRPTGSCFRRSTTPLCQSLFRPRLLGIRRRILKIFRTTLIRRAGIKAALPTAAEDASALREVGPTPFFGPTRGSTLRLGRRPAELTRGADACMNHLVAVSSRRARPCLGRCGSGEAFAAGRTLDGRIQPPWELACVDSTSRNPPWMAPPLRSSMIGLGLGRGYGENARYIYFLAGQYFSGHVVFVFGLFLISFRLNKPHLSGPGTSVGKEETSHYQSLQLNSWLRLGTWNSAPLRRRQRAEKTHRAKEQNRSS